MATFRSVLVATDFSKASRDALALAASIACESGAGLTVVHACEVPGYAETGPIPYDLVTPVAREAQVRLDAILESLRRSCPGARGLLKVGAAAEQILAAAAETKADLVVMGTHGRHGLAHAFMGSVAEHVVRASPVPVLTARSRGVE